MLSPQDRIRNQSCDSIALRGTVSASSHRRFFYIFFGEAYLTILMLGNRPQPVDKL